MFEEGEGYAIHFTGYVLMLLIRGHSKIYGVSQKTEAIQCKARDRLEETDCYLSLAGFLLFTLFYHEDLSEGYN
jgi:hypothetical protein